MSHPAKFHPAQRPIFFVTALFVVLVSFAACVPGMNTAPANDVSQAASEPTATSAPAPEATDTTAQEKAPDAAANVPASGGTRTFQIDPAQSKARFYIDELLAGKPKTVIGETSKVSGSITVDLADVSKSTLGPIQIDASDFTTDSSMRNGAIRRFILQSNKAEYQYITFEPTTLEGLPNSAKVSDALTFKVTGNLKIRDIVNPATFDVTVNITADNQLTGIAKTTVTRTAYQLSIPSVPNVANVAEDVPLEFEFVAVSQ